VYVVKGEWKHAKSAVQFYCTDEDCIEKPEYSAVDEMSCIHTLHTFIIMLWHSLAFGVFCNETCNYYNERLCVLYVEMSSTITHISAGSAHCNIADVHSFGCNFLLELFLHCTHRIVA